MSSEVDKKRLLSLLALVAGAMLVAAPQARSGERQPSKPSASASTSTQPCRAVTAGRLPFQFSIDGVPAEGHGAPSSYCVDKALAAADIQIRYDGLEIEPRLNVAAGPDAARRGRAVHFETYSNYALQLERGEVRIFRKGATPTHAPYAVLPLHHGVADWVVPVDSDDTLTYVLRVYDAADRFDETAPKTLDVAHVKGGTLAPLELAAVYGANALAIRNIPISGGAVLVSGRGMKPDHAVSVMGLDVPVDDKGDFAIRQIVAPGSHRVDVTIADEKGIVSSFSRTAIVPTHDFFYVALADLLVGKGTNSGPIDLLKPATADEYKNDVYVNGRLAFYLKGKVRGDTLLTAAADTRDQPFRHIFSNFDSKDPRYLLRNLDPNRYYPVYGDDSTLVDDAPTRGKFYVRIERGDSSVVWGNFKTTTTGTEFTRYERGLYGARAQTKTADTTAHGERRGTLEVFAAEPGTLGARDVFRGTGGSLYYLQRQNVTEGSERVTVESRDRSTGLVLQARTLVPTQDYEMNYLQGRVILRAPLASTGTSDFIVQSGSLSGTEQFLVVSYEYTPDLTASRDRVVGLRGSYWLDDAVRIGVTSYDQNTPGQNLLIGGLDLTLRATTRTYVKLEGARSSGPGSGEAVSVDGGFTFDTRRTAGKLAWARGIEAVVDLADILPGAKGRIAGFWKDKDADFSGPGELSIVRASREAGLVGESELSDRWSGRSKIDMRRDEFRKYTAAEQNLTYRFDDYWKATVGARHDNNRVSFASASPYLNQFGRRTDVAAKIEYDQREDWTRYIFGQVTVDRTGTRDAANRIGVGGTQRLDEKTKLLAEISTGNAGIGGKAGVEHKIDEKRTSYLTYAYDPDRTDIVSRGGAGLLTAGTRQRFSDSFSIFGEERARHGGGFSGLTHAFGLDFVPLDHWKGSLAFETGDLSDPYGGDVERTAVSATVSYADKGMSFTGKYEFRHDAILRGTISSERETYLTTNTLGIKVDKDWRFIGKVAGSYSTSSQGDFYRGDYVEAVTGFAYRPASDNRLNALFKYTYFYDLPTPGQRVNVLGGNDYSQHSHVFSVDTSYEINRYLTLGAKYAFRIGEVKDNLLGGPWFKSHAHLLIGRADFHVLEQWDLSAEIRRLSVSSAQDSETGALVAVYRHFGKNFKFGAGYNFTEFSDDLTNLSNRNRGVFLNAIGKF